MPIYWRRKLTRLEAALSAAFFAVLIAVFLERTLSYMELAERTAMELTVQHVNAALLIRRAIELLEGGAVEPNKALERSPFELASVRIGNVHPDVASASALAALERRYWVFDRGARQLIYLPQLHRGLHTDDAQPLVRFQIVPGNDAYRLVPAAKYSWD
jgi:hypothetical protein